MRCHLGWAKSSNDLRDTTSIFTSYVVKHGSITKNKHWEIELYYNNYYWFEFLFGIRWSGEDHAGIQFEIGVLGYHFCIHIYDNRHWDDDTRSWETEL